MSEFTVDERIARLFGELPGTRRGVLHPVAVCRNADKGLSVLKIRPDTPKSDSDFFSLSLSRARADAIVTSGRILREEPDVSHGLTPELATWRREALGKPQAPISAVLTSGRDLDLDHPLFRYAENALVFTSLEATAQLAAAAASRGIELVGSDDPGPSGLIDYLLREKHARIVSLEAGPTTVRQVYERSAESVDELLLSTYHGAVSPTLVGPAFLSREELDARFSVRSTEQQVEETSGIWSFRRYQRA